MKPPEITVPPNHNTRPERYGDPTPVRKCRHCGGHLGSQNPGDECNICSHLEP